MPPIEWPTAIARSICSFCRLRRMLRACELNLEELVLNWSRCRFEGQPFDHETAAAMAAGPGV